jgi:ribonuclease HI
MGLFSSIAVVLEISPRGKQLNYVL